MKNQKQQPREWPNKNLGTFTKYPVAVKVLKENGVYLAEVHTYGPRPPQRFALAAADRADARAQGLSLLDTLGHVYKVGAEAASQSDDTNSWFESFLKTPLG
jgi:hypothetical protein